MMVRAIVSATWLAQHRAEPNVRIVDVRWYLTAPDQGRREYEAAHIPGAVFMDLESDLSAQHGPGRHPLPDPETFAGALGRLGISNDAHIVVYDDSYGAIAARMWWMLRHIGHGAVSVLDGGYRSWRDSGFETTYAIPKYSPADFVVRMVRNDTIDRNELAGSLGDHVLLDVRDAPRYRGELEPVDSFAGHIPTAINAPFSENLNADGTFKSPEELAAMFGALGVHSDESVVVSCGSGVTACHTILAMHLAGAADPRLYPGSWSDWSAAAYPVATGPQPGTVPGHMPWTTNQE